MKTKMTIHKHFFSTISVIFLFFATTLPIHAAQLTLSSKTDDTTVVIEMSLDKVEKLAGMKVAFDYPKNALLVKNTKKSSNLNSFMHVVNDKNPGKLIIVLASATGVSGKNMKLFEVTFSRVKKSEADTLILEPTECQLMSEALLSIPCVITPLTISTKQK